MRQSALPPPGCWGNNLLKGRRYTCSGELGLEVTDGEYVMEDVVEDGNLLSGRGLGVAFDFALTLALRLTGNKGRSISRLNISITVRG